jgi:hypothetical protein
VKRRRLHADISCPARLARVVLACHLAHYDSSLVPGNGVSAARQ